MDSFLTMKLCYSIAWSVINKLNFYLLLTSDFSKCFRLPIVAGHKQSTDVMIEIINLQRTSV